MASNANLTRANRAKNDEFYTRLTDIEKELKHYRKHFNMLGVSPPPLQVAGYKP